MDKSENRKSAPAGDQKAVSGKTEPPEKAAPKEIARPAEEERPAKEIGGPRGPEPTRYGDWERKGITSDF